MAQHKTCVMALKGFTNINGGLEQARVSQATMLMFPPSMKEMFEKCNRDSKSLINVPLTKVIPTAVDVCDDLLILYLSPTTLGDYYFKRYRDAFASADKKIVEQQVL